MQPLGTLDTELYVDVVAFNRHAHPHVLAVGCYQLDEASGTRNGSLLICNVDRDGVISKPRMSCDLPGVLHAAWVTERTMALALADGHVRMVGLEGLGGSAVTVEHIGIRVVEDGALALWVDVGRDDDADAVCSCSDGSVAVVDYNVGGVKQSWHAHDLEAWVAVFDNEGMVYSGADDALMRCWDVRNDPSQGPVWTTARGAHGAGVTSIHPLASHPYLVLSGSYDCTLRVWDVRGGGRRPVVEHALELGGGVWRMQPNPQDASVWLMACMQEGVKVLHKHPATHTFDIVQHYPHHRVLAYGADWKHDGRGLVATASFYEKSVHVWQPEAIGGGGGGAE